VKLSDLFLHLNFNDEFQGRKNVQLVRARRGDVLTSLGPTWGSRAREHCGEGALIISVLYKIEVHATPLHMLGYAYYLHVA